MVREHFKKWNQSKYRVLMIKTVLYFHGFASSSDSKKAVKACDKDSSGKKCKQANTRKTKSCSVLLDF